MTQLNISCSLSKAFRCIRDALPCSTSLLTVVWSGLAAESGSGGEGAVQQGDQLSLGEMMQTKHILQPHNSAPCMTSVSLCDTSLLTVVWFDWLQRVVAVVKAHVSRAIS